MLLALKPPNLMQTDLKQPHEYSTFKSAPSKYSPPESPRNIPSLFEDRMTNPHRGLPLPAGLSLPPPDRTTSGPSLGHLPAPPSQWAGQDESMRSWLHAKAEEDRRKQEEEKTRQEGLKLDQRKIEERMLRDSLQGGIPPPMVPLIFAGMGGGNLSAHTLEWAQQYLASMSIQNQQQQQQIQAQQQQIQQQAQQIQQPQMSPDIRRDSRMIPPNPYGSSHQPPQPSQSSPQLSSQQNQPQSRSIGAPTTAPQASTLSRLNTTDFVPAPQQRSQPLHPLQQSQTASSEQGSGPGLFFHHWTPPNPSSAGQPPTPSGKSAQSSPFGQAAASHLRADYQNSPKKRKAAGGQPVPVPPTSQPQETSPPYSSRSSRERELSPGSASAGRPRQHSRQHSSASSRDAEGRHIARPSSRQQRQDELAGVPSGDAPRRQLTTGSSTSSDDNNPNRYEGMKSETR
jgi:hypothetical protein